MVCHVRSFEITVASSARRSMPQVTLLTSSPSSLDFVLSPFLVLPVLAPAGASNDQGHRKPGDMSAVFPPHNSSFVRDPERQWENTMQQFPLSSINRLSFVAEP
jgi:hypothetical protein